MRNGKGEASLMEEFYDAIELAKKIEKNALSQLAFKDKVEVSSAIDFYPEEYVGLTHSDLINMYERVQKIRSAAKLEMYGDTTQEEKAAPELARRTAEVEEDLKQMTDARLEEIKELEKPSKKTEKEAFEEIHIEKEEEEGPKKEFSLEVEKKPTGDFEFESFDMEEGNKRQEKEGKGEKEEGEGEKEEEEINPAAEEVSPELPELEQEEEKEAKGEEEGEEQEKEEKEEIMPSRIKEEEEEEIRPEPEEAEQKPAPKTFPRTREAFKAPEEVASGKFRDVEEVVSRELGTKMDETALKRKMLDLTKELFKERSFTRREKIKLEIVALKNMLVRGVEKKPARGAKASPSKEYAANILETISSTQAAELSSKKDTLASLYKNRIEEIKKKFHSKLKDVPEGSTTERKRIYDVFAFELKSLAKTLPGDSKKVMDFLAQKHKSEIDNLRKSAAGAESSVSKAISARLKQIEAYDEQFDSIIGIISKNIETLIETGSGEVVAREKKDVEVSSVVSEINDTDEGTMLYFLHSKEPELYRKYERNHISKSEALQYARFLMAKDKGLSNADIKKYFGDVSRLDEA